VTRPEHKDPTVNAGYRQAAFALFPGVHTGNRLKLLFPSVDELSVTEAVAVSASPECEGVPRHHLARLLDRPAFFALLRRAITRNEGAGDDLALLAMAVDPFVVADSAEAWKMREEVGTVTAGRMVGCLHYACVTARIAGDEFLVLVEGMGVEGTIQVSEQILVAVRWPDPQLFEETCLTASIGIAFHEPGLAAEQLLINADMAMYSARRAGGDRCRVFEEWMREAALTSPLVS
jgi:diguanylate cyclase (GGDEF)-like protein